VAAVASPLPDPAAERAALLFERHHDAVLGYCAWRLRVRDDAEEAAQTTFARAFGALRRGHLPRNERAWLVTIARNVCTTLVTSPHRLREVAGDVPESASHEVDHGLDPALEAALAALPEGQRRAVLLREWQDLSYREIAAELGVSVGIVETWIFRGRRSLASALEHTRRGLGFAGLLRCVAPSAGAKVAAVVVLATAAVATEQAVVPRGAADRPRAKSPAPAPAPAPPLAKVSTPRLSGTTAPRTATAPAAHAGSKRRTPPAARLAGAHDIDRIQPTQTAAPVPDPKQQPKPVAPSAPSAATPQLPAPTQPSTPMPELPVSTPTLPPVEAPSLPALPPLPTPDLPPLPTTADLPVDAPKLP
jgi:RNA polymerase sigma factor (sigma-70 family)